MSWNYRFFKHPDGTYSVRESYYYSGDRENPNGWTRPIALDLDYFNFRDAETPEMDEYELKSQTISMLEMIIAGLKKPTVEIEKEEDV